MNEMRNMAYSQIQQQLLKELPKVDELMQELRADVPRSVRLRASRETLAELRSSIMESSMPDPGLLERDAVITRTSKKLEKLLAPSLRPVVNATGVIIHTNLGRSPLPPEILRPMLEVASRYSNLEYNVETGIRGSRYSHVEDLLCELTGAESALIVNNNAAAVLITLATLAKGKEVIVSRGELVEIGGSFRIPDVMASSGAILREVGTTNRTHLRDYEAAVCAETALLLKVHQSNYQVVGFTKAVPMPELVQLGSRYGLPVFNDLGSGSLVDLSRFGLIHEPTVQETLDAGVDVVSFSGDKLLGGPQAGIIVGKKEFTDRIKKNPLNRAVRIDKLTLVALEGILRIYRDPELAASSIPTLTMLSTPWDAIRARARRLLRGLRALKLAELSIEVTETVSRVGGGALPLQQLKSLALTLTPLGGRLSAARMGAALRENDPPVVVRIENESILMDVRTLLEPDLPLITQAVRSGYERALSG
jgi:L-seryl-tRNA(Ser) seleniumtransferase